MKRHIRPVSLRKRLQRHAVRRLGATRRLANHFIDFACNSFDERLRHFNHIKTDNDSDKIPAEFILLHCLVCVTWHCQPAFQSATLIQLGISLHYTDASEKCCVHLQTLNI